MFTVRRSPHNPLVEPNSQHPWEAFGTFNGSPVTVQGKTHVLFRALGRPDPLRAPGVYLSSIGKATSEDGETFLPNHTQFIAPSEPWDMFGCEDPRVTFFEGKYYTFYTAVGGVPFGASNIKVACAVSSDLETVEEKHLVTPFNAKAMALFPERINGKVTVLFTAHPDEPPQKMVFAQADSIEEFFTEAFWHTWHTRIDDHTITLVRSDVDFTEVGAVPVYTDEGWLLIYSYIQDYFDSGRRTFTIEAALLDHHDIRKVRGHSHSPLLTPEEPYEQYGVVGRVVFPSGALVRGDTLDIYYGGGDTCTAKASVHLPHLIDSLVPERRVQLVERFAQNPIRRPQKDGSFESRCVFNPAAIDIDGTAYILFRAMSEDNTSTVGLAISRDGERIDEVLKDPIYVPRAPFEMKRGTPTGNSGCEDPRIVRVDDYLYIFYTSYDGVEHPCVAFSKIHLHDFVSRRFNMWSEPIRISPSGVGDKDAAVFPKKIDGKYLLIHRIDPIICGDYFTDLNFTEFAVKRCIEIAHPRPGTWEHEKVGIAGPPIETSEGWLLIYHAVSKHKHYQLGALLLDKENPTLIRGRLSEPLLAPEREYERVGDIPNVVFSCGQIVRGDTVLLYYGGADMYLCGATFSLSELLKRLTWKPYTQ